MTINDTPPLSPATDDDPGTALEPDPSTAAGAETKVKIRRPHDPDAAIGVKTSKDGKIESFYGYHEHTLVRVRGPRDAADSVPALVAGLELTPASADVVDVSLDLLDRLRVPAAELIVDRHYSYKAPDRWRDELADRSIRQVLDLRADEQGFTDLNHMRWAAAWPHCPATPDTYGTITRPAPSDENHEAKLATFKKRLKERRAYAFRRVTSPNPRGVARWECPAEAGTVGCPLKPGTVEAALQIGLPVVENPPDPTSPDFPTCCRQRTVKVDPGPLRKLMQEHYWGSDEWEAAWNKRTYVEGSYGNRKNPSTENLRRGHFRTTGITLVNLMTAMAAASYNLRMLRAWHERTGLGDPDHPLLEPATEPGTFLQLTPEEYARYCAAWTDPDGPEP
jgi:hypothetical protein